MNPTITIAEALRHGVTRLADSESARLDTEVLLAHALGCTRATLRAWPERMLSAAQSEAYADLLTRRAAGEPVAYLTGEREFWSLPLTVTPDTLIPRPETERLVELALECLVGIPAARIADLGTGSGAIALALASERPDCHVIATDASPAALDVARANAARLGIANIEFRAGIWCDALRDERFDLIASNPPYVRSGDPHLRTGDVRFEPDSALAADIDGLRDLRTLVGDAGRYLKPGAWLLLEHGYDQGKDLMDLLARAGFTEIRDLTDTAGLPRVAMGRQPGGQPANVS